MDGYQALAKCLTEYTPEQVIRSSPIPACAAGGRRRVPDRPQMGPVRPQQGAAEICGLQRG